jgi:hypothetical protein
MSDETVINPKRELQKIVDAISPLLRHPYRLQVLAYKNNQTIQITGTEETQYGFPGQAGYALAQVDDTRYENYDSFLECIEIWVPAYCEGSLRTALESGMWKNKPQSEALQDSLHRLWGKYLILSPLELIVTEIKS